jgi:hypothetical protein
MLYICLVILGYLDKFPMMDSKLLLSVIALIKNVLAEYSADIFRIRLY